VTVYDRTNSTKIADGKLGSVDNQVDTSTGTVKLRAVFDNRDGKLFPQQFVNAKLLVDTLQDAIIVPTAAIQLGAPGSYVYLVNSDSTVSIRVIQPGPVDGERAAILSGLELGETVVNDGVDRLYDGAKVQLPEKRPSNEVSGRPHRFSGRPDGSPREHHHRENGDEPRRHPPDAS
jgi:membrane fusion protein, multidrug efflux system